MDNIINHEVSTELEIIGHFDINDIKVRASHFSRIYYKVLCK